MVVKSNTFSKIAAYILLVIFCVAQTVEVLHHHNDAATYQSIKANPSQKHTALKGVCSICNLIAQQSHRDRNYLLVVSFTPVAIHAFYYTLSAINPTVSGFKKQSGNKGPPSII